MSNGIVIKEHLRDHLQRESTLDGYTQNAYQEALACLVITLSIC
jgi:hypothetical protein